MALQDELESSLRTFVSQAVGLVRSKEFELIHLERPAPGDHYAVGIVDHGRPVMLLAAANRMSFRLGPQRSLEFDRIDPVDLIVNRMKRLPSSIEGEEQRAWVAISLCSDVVLTLPTHGDWPSDGAAAIRSQLYFG